MKKLFYSLLICAVFFTTNTFGQSAYSDLFYNGGAVVHVQGGALLHVQGGLTNSSGTFTNNGVVNVEGNISNSGTFAENTALTNTSGNKYERTIRLIGANEVTGVAASGTREQQILGTWSGGSSYFYNLVIDKATAGDIVTVGSNVEIKDSLIWGAANSQFASTVNTTLTGRTNPSRTGKGIVKMTNGGSDYELFISNPDPTAVVGYQAISAFNYSTSPAALSGTNNDGYIQFRGVNGVASGFARQVDRSATYIFPVGSPTATYNPIKIYFNGTPSAAMKLVSKFTDNDFSALSIANSFDQTNSASPANTMSTINFPIDYTNNPGFNIFQKSACGGSLGNWFIMDKILKNHGYWSFNATPALAGTTYVAEAYPHGYAEYVSNGSDPNKRVIRTDIAPFNGTPAVSDFGSQIESGLSAYSDIITYSYFKNHKNYTACNDGDGITGGKYSSFSHFAVGTSSSNTGNALPVTLIDLSADPIENSYIRVNWATASEIDNKGFEVMRSEDGINFANIGWVAGNGSTTSQHDYLFNDKTVIPNVTYYYKLNQVDIDGHSIETYIVSAKITDGADFNISEFQPNPTMGNTKLIINTTAAMASSVKFFNILGAEVMSHEYQLVAGTNSLDFDSNNLAAATYTAIIKVGNNIYSKKLVIAR